MRGSTGAAPAPRSPEERREEARGTGALRADLIFSAAALAYFVYLLWRVAALPLCEWDEARNVLNAHEMLRSGDFVALRWQGALDHYNLKPPLFLWALAACFRLFGYSEVTARLPALLFGMGTAVMIYRFVARAAGDRFFAGAVALALVSATGFYGFHGLTSGDVDMGIVFFATLSFIAIHRIFVEERPRWFLVLGLSVGLGFMTKSVVGLLPLGLAPIALAIGRRPRVLLSPWLAAGVAIAIAVVAPWLIARERGYPDDYIRLMLGRDVVERSTTVLEEHAGDWTFYYRFAVEHLGKWVYLMFFAAVSLVAAALEARKARDPSQAMALRAAALAAFGLVFYYVAFSIPVSKLKWYFYPAYPLVFMLAGIGVARFASFWPRALRAAVVGLMLVANLFEIAAYDAHRLSGVPIVDYVIWPSRAILQGKELATEGDLRQNGLALTDIYAAGGRAEHFPAGTPLDEILARAPATRYLVAVDAQLYERDPRVRPVRMLEIQGTGQRIGILRVVGR